MLKKSRKIVLIICLSLVVTFCSYIYLGLVLAPKDMSDRDGMQYYRATAINMEEDNSLDLLFMGNSQIYSGVDPMRLYEQTGIRSFDCAYPYQSVVNVKKQLKKLVKIQSPKVVMFETDCMFYPNNPKAGSGRYSSLWLRQTIKYWHRWGKVKISDFFTIPKPQKDVFKGMLFSKKVTDYEVPESYMSDVDAQKASIRQSNIDDLKEIKKICDERGITLILFCVPNPAEHTCARSYALQELADEMGVTFWDLNLPEYGLEVVGDWFADEGIHMNFFGATHVTDVLKTHIQTNFDFEDYRNVDTAWDKNLIEYKKRIE